MAQTPVNRMSAIKDDGFIDFYELLGVETDATLTRLRTTINALYNEAQANRDHRNLNRRREYQTFLQLLPQARDLLLEDKHRDRYDAFREEVQNDSAAISFEDWYAGLKEEEEQKDSKGSSVLGVQGEGEGEVEDTSPRASVTKIRKKHAASRVVVEESTPPVAPARQSLIGSVIAVVVFMVLLLVLLLGAHLSLGPAVAISGVAAIVTWLATHRKPKQGTKV